MISLIIKTEVCVICRSRRLRQITQTSVLIIHDIMRKPNSIIVLLYIFKQFANEDKLSHICKSLTALHGRGTWKLGGFELDMITQYLLQILGYHVEFTCYCILTECSRPIRCFKVILMYNKCIYPHSRFGAKEPTE